MLTSLADQLYTAIEEERLLAEELHGYGVQKKDALVAVNTSVVDELTKKEHKILMTLGSAGTTRMRLTSKLGKMVGLETPSVTEIAKKFGEPHSMRLRSSADRLKAVLTELAKITKTNQVLTKESIGFVKTFFGLLGSNSQENVGYSKPGYSTPSAPGRLMIDEVV
jgi:hypothetical protein